MATHSQSDLQFEIGHVLFIDIVGYSKLLIDEQRERIRELKGIVRGTEQFRLAEAEGKLLRLPTGDGGALVFRNTQEAPVLCALEISKALKRYPELQVRMGIHSGPVNEVADLNEQMNVAGAGINIARRVMDCGDAGHILLSKHVAEDLEDYARWRPYLHELGECEAKHGGVISLVNLYDDEVGNPQLPEKLKQAQRERAAKAAASRPAPTFRRKHVLTAAAAFLTAASGLVVWFYSRQANVTTLPPEKSVAVLPFENLSEEKGNAYFADGIQEEILTRLAKIADLKVISRTSTQQFQSKPANLSEIAKQLGVANILEGSVQRSADQVRVNVQLINAATDAHLWADTFDRKLTDIFAVESDIATTIAETLQAKLTGAEKTAVAKRPTANTEAYELYLKGRFFWNKRTGADLRTAIDYFNQAIGKDPSYALAYAGLADSYDLLPPYGAASPADSYPRAKSAAKKALELDDTLAEAHTSLGLALDNYHLDFEQSLKEYERAIRLNPNYATAHHWHGELLGAMGRFDEAIAQLKRAQELDPLSLIINCDLGEGYTYARQYDKAIEQLRKAIEMDPRFYYAHRRLGEVLQLTGRLDDAIAEYRKAVELNDDPSVLALLGQAYARAGQQEEGQRILARLSEEAKSRYVSAYSFALIFLALGDKERAIDEIERAYRERAGEDIDLIKVDPLLDDLHGNPRFEALVQKVLAPKNSQTGASQL
jgi:TolB-like protein/class 3 adenylate cyclase/Flp pilus assembly protein TadD